MTEIGISWPSDVENKFFQPEGFTYAEYTNLNLTCPEVLGAGYTNCGRYVVTNSGNQVNQTYYYWYPDDENVQYLHESFPNVVSPLEGVKNEHFVNWMRTAGLPQFRKLYGIISKDVNKGDVIVFDVMTNYEVASFSGSKKIILTTLADFGNRNYALGNSAIIIGTASLAVGILFAVKRVFNPRSLGDIRVLNWK